MPEQLILATFDPSGVTLTADGAQLWIRPKAIARNRKAGMPEGSFFIFGASFLVPHLLWTG